jgi:hypothetical protein
LPGIESKRVDALAQGDVFPQPNELNRGALLEFESHFGCRYRVVGAPEGAWSAIDQVARAETAGALVRSGGHGMGRDVFPEHSSHPLTEGAE